ncbi:MAG: 3-methyl-2-oxobutanoate hydroxymethyltransferase, partial [Pseudomonadota bacterium]
ENRGHIPRHAKVYRNFAAERDRLQQERISAYQEYIADVNAASYPATEHDVSIAGEELSLFLAQL